jgi:hypothetical protein
MPTIPARLRSTMNAMSQALGPVLAPLGQTILIAACRVDLPDRTPVRLRSTVNVMSLASGPVRALRELIDQTVVPLLLLPDRTPAHLRSTVNVTNLALGPVRVTLERIDQIAVDQRRRSRLPARHRSRPLVRQPRAPGFSQPSRVRTPKTR